MKYEAVFGDQSLFDRAPEDAEFVAIESSGYVTFYKNVKANESYEYFAKESAIWEESFRNPCNPFKAMRRIIEEPKRWTIEDQKAGQLPEVGCMVMVTSVDEFASVAAINNDAVCVVFYDGEFTTLHKSGISPLETPEEKAQREEDEFISSLSGADIQDGTVKDFFAQGARAAYRKLKGGE